MRYARRMELLTVTDLACARGGIRLLDGVSFTLSAGRALILRGPNGSGKTTLLRTLAGLQRPAAGRVRCDPEGVAYAAHADGIKPTLTVAENLRFWAAVYGQGADPLPAMSAYRMEGLADRLAHHLSAGQKRRLSLARMLVTGRRVWAMDEPTVSLDRDAVALFAGVVTAHLAGGGAAIIATHIDLGLDGAEVLEVDRFRASAVTHSGGFGDDW